MELNEKLQQLRKEKGWTQEQLAERLFVSRTAVSKWESGKGYPNIDSLKNISKLYNVSIDVLLSGEELLSLAQSENRTNIGKVTSLAFGSLDLLSPLFLLLPLYGQPEGEHVRMVNLLSFTQAPAFMIKFYFLLLFFILVFGIFELIAHFWENDKWFRFSRAATLFLQAVAVVGFISTQQPYAASLMFLFFCMKILLLLRSIKMK